MAKYKKWSLPENNSVVVKGDTITFTFVRQEDGKKGYSEMKVIEYNIQDMKDNNITKEDVISNIKLKIDSVIDKNKKTIKKSTDNDNLLDVFGEDFTF